MLQNTDGGACEADLDFPTNNRTTRPRPRPRANLNMRSGHISYSPSEFSHMNLSEGFRLVTSSGFL
jgi:hypothetical protein